ncbi:MAG: 16S rRNA (guanine(527)-N(7))-methyltransferase RsmG [Myxococcaceae bacterium]
MDNVGAARILQEGAEKLGIVLSDEAAGRLVRLGEELLRWNQKVNLTAITRPDEVLEKHFLDSLAVLPELAPARSLLDLGAGAGFPGLPLKVARPDLEVTLVDAVAKKVGFMKHAIALLGLSPGARAVHARAEGRPREEGLPQAEAVVARALADPARWLALAAPYALPGGRVLAMLARPLGPEEAQRQAAAAGLRFLFERTYALPFCGDPRAVAVFAREG